MAFWIGIYVFLNFIRSFRYIEHLTQYRTVLRMWLDRSVACLQLITNQEVKLQYALSIAKLAPVPWPTEMNPIIELRVSSHPFAKEIDNEYKMQQVKMLRLKYGWQANSSDDPTKFVQRMIKQNRDELLDDLEIFKRFSSDINPATNFYAVYGLASVGCMHKVQQYLKTLNNDEAHVCYTRIAKIVPLMIDDYVDKPELHGNLMELLQFVLDKDVDDESKQQIKDLMNLQLLKKNALNMTVALSDLSDTAKVNAYLDTGLQKLLSILKEKEKNLSIVIWQSVNVLAKALKLNKFTIIFKLIKIINNVRFTALLARIFRDEHADSPKDYIDMAVMLITQQYHESTTESIGPDSDAFAYPMANLYLQKVKGMDMIDVQQLRHFTQIGANAFEITHFQQFLNGNDVNDDEVRKK